MNTSNQYPNIDEMVAGMIAVATRANGSKVLTKEKATLLIQDHISASEPRQCKQNSTDHLPENCLGSYQHHSTCALYVQQENLDQADHSPLTHQQGQAKPTLTPQCK